MRTSPDGLQTVETVPNFLRVIAHFLGRHNRVRPIEFGTMSRRYEPAPGNGNTGNLRGMIAHTLLPAIKVHGAGKWSQHHELGKGDLGALGDLRSGAEGFWTIARQPKNEGAEHAHSMALEGLEAFDQAFSG